MLWDASSLRGYSVAVSGEHFGKIADFLFAGPDWAIASLVIEAGSWLQSRRVVVPVADFGHPIVETRTITLQLTADQVAQLPDHAPDLSVVDMHSLDTIAKASVEGTDTNVGHIEDFLIDTGNWLVRYLIINPSDWLSEEKILVPTATVTAISAADATVQLSVTRQFVKDGPQFDPDQTADGAYDDQFLTYYGIRFAKK